MREKVYKSAIARIYPFSCSIRRGVVPKADISKKYSLSGLKLEFSKIGYSFGRKTASKINEYSRKITGQQEDYETVLRFGDMLVRNMPDFLFKYDAPKCIETDFLGIRFPSPILIAAYKGDYNVLLKWERLGASAITKTMMSREQFGNARPRHITFKDDDGIEKHINSYGLPSKGIYKEIKLFEESGLLESKIPLGISFGGENVEEYAYVIESLAESPKIKSAMENNLIFFQPNIGCPNSETGHDICKTEGAFEKLIEELDSICARGPYLFKIPPYISGMNAEESDKKILQIAEICASYDGTGMALANTILADASDKNRFIVDACLNLSEKSGGLSGSDCKRRAIKLTEKIAAKYDIPISLCGGIKNAYDIVEGKEAGAKIFEMATAVGRNPYAAIVQTNWDLASIIEGGK